MSPVSLGRPVRLVLAAALSSGALTAAPAAAQLAVQFTSSLTTSAPVSATFGYSFTTTAAATVTGLAYYQPFLGGGPLGGSTVRLYDAAGTTLASTMVTVTDPTLGTGAFFYNVGSITPVTLLASATYYVAGDVNASAPNVLFDATGVTTDPRIAFGNAVSASGLGMNPKTDGFGIGGNSYLVVDFRLEATTVPEPATVALTMTGLLLLGGAARWRLT